MRKREVRKECGYVIISLFLFSQEFTRIKWSENENGRRARWRVEREESLSLSFPKGWLVAGEWDQLDSK